MNHCYIFLADGFEETEALATLDILRRAGLYARTVSVNGRFEVTGSHGISVNADTCYELFCTEEEELDTSDVLIFPGGMPGSKNLAENGELMTLMKEHFRFGGRLAAICAAPGLVVSQNDNLEGRRFTCYDGFESYLQEKGAIYVQTPAVTDGNLITGRGPAFAIDFALAIVESVLGEAKTAEVRRGLLL